MNMLSIQLILSYKLLYYSRHQGTIDDFNYFPLNYQQIHMTTINPIVYYRNYGMSISDGYDLLDQYSLNFTNYMNYYDAIVISDTIVDSIPFLLLLNQSIQFNSHIILQVTNRYDYRCKEIVEYNHLLSSIQNHSQVHWIINNPWEQIYMALKNLTIKSPTLIRPFGVSNLPANQLTHNDISKCAYLTREKDEYDVFKQLHLHFNDSIIYLQHDYGGPKTLAQYKCFIHFPYQVSVMKMSQNLYEGVATIIPTKKFFQELIMNGIKGLADQPYRYRWRAKAISPNYQWDDYIEFYNNRYKNYFFHFNDFQQLNDIINKPKDDIYFHELVNRSKEFGFIDRSQQLQSMKQFFVNHLHWEL